MVKSDTLTLAQLQKLAKENGVVFSGLKKSSLKSKLSKAGVDMTMVKKSSS
jgi:hypothetical protein